MSSLYVNENGAVISVDGGYFCVKNNLVRKIPKELLESITIFGNSFMIFRITNNGCVW